MYSKQKDIRWIMVAVVVLLANTPLGKATTVHIPVIIGAIILLTKGELF